jgi:hypothetical protein
MHRILILFLQQKLQDLRKRIGRKIIISLSLILLDTVSPITLAKTLVTTEKHTETHENLPVKSLLFYSYFNQ